MLVTETTKQILNKNLQRLRLKYKCKKLEQNQGFILFDSNLKLSKTLVMIFKTYLDLLARLAE